MTHRSSWQEHVRRGIAIGIAVSLHLLVLVLILRPDLDWREARTDRTETQRLQLRFLRSQATPSKWITVPRLPSIPTSRHAHPEQTKLPSQPAASEHVSPAVPMIATPVAPDATVAPKSHSGTDGDGGFRERLRQAQQSSATRNVPGSDASVVPGIRLVDPDTQGVRAVARKVQRLFGITSRHCIDVEVLRHLTPQQLNDRHISSSDLDRLNEEYHCDEPLGLSF